jgi:hypothetical protein
MQRHLSSLQKILSINSSIYSKKLNFHFISLKPLITKRLDLHFVLNENLDPGLQEASELFDNQEQQKFQKELEEENEKNVILQYLESKGLSKPEINEDDPESIAFMPVGRIFELKKNYKKIMTRQFLLTSKNLFDQRNYFENLLIIPDIESPREMVPNCVWANFKEKMKGLEKIKLCAGYFFEQIPDVVSQDHKVLKKYKFGDFPNERFYYEPEFDYYQKPFSGVEWDRKGKNKGLPLDRPGVLSKLKGFVENIERKVVFGKKKVFRKSFLFCGEDLEGLVEDIGKLPGFKAGLEVTELGDKYVHIFYKMRNCIEKEEIEKLNRKYGKEILAGVEEIDIDEEDQESLSKLLKLNQSPAITIKQYLKERDL